LLAESCQAVPIGPLEPDLAVSAGVHIRVSTFSHNQNPFRTFPLAGCAHRLGERLKIFRGVSFWLGIWPGLIARRIKFARGLWLESLGLNLCRSPLARLSYQV
jgi:hypothetical protein